MECQRLPRLLGWRRGALPLCQTHQAMPRLSLLHMSSTELPWLAHLQFALPGVLVAVGGVQLAVGREDECEHQLRGGIRIRSNSLVQRHAVKGTARPCA